MYDRFTDRARFAWNLADEEAWRFHHNYMGTEHLPLGILREATSPAAQLLEKHGVTLGRSRDLIHELLKP